MTAPQVLIHDDTDQLAGAFAARLLTRLADLQAEGRVPSVVLTGGSIAYTAYRAVVDSPACGAVDWSRVDFWWGDERFVPADSDDRNAKAAFGSFLDHVGVDRDRVHVIPASDGAHGDDVDAAAAAYAEELGKHTPLDHPDEPLFDVLILGIGQNGHCASLMPDAPALDEERPVVAVRNSPKPPPTRISMTFGPLLRARELWWIAAGEDKAGPVHDAVNGADVRRVPAAKPRGLDRTVWLLDRAAASRLR